jgi:hypothetical protein
MSELPNLGAHVPVAYAMLCFHLGNINANAQQHLTTTHYSKQPTEFMLYLLKTSS